MPPLGRVGGDAPAGQLNSGLTNIVILVIRFYSCPRSAALTQTEGTTRGVAQVLRRVRRGLGAIGVGITLALIASCAGVVVTHDVSTSDQVPSNAEVSGPLEEEVTGPYPVSKVVDGDTIWVQREGQPVKLRLIGIDTPEVHDPRKPVQCFGREAAAAAESMLAGQQVLLESDSSQASVDRYGRELVYVWVDGRLVNLVMIQDGYAHEFTYEAPYRYQSAFRAAQQHAEQAGLGLWSPDTCAGDTTKSGG